MIVVDANVWVRALVDPAARGRAARRVLESDPIWAAPAHAPIEAIRTIRRFELEGLIATWQADEHARKVAERQVRYVVPNSRLVAKVWDWRHRLSMYDAPYVYAASELDVSLVTFDRRLARAAGDLGVEVVVPEAES